MPLTASESELFTHCAALEMVNLINPFKDIHAGEFDYRSLMLKLRPLWLEIAAANWLTVKVQERHRVLKAQFYLDDMITSIRTQSSDAPSVVDLLLRIKQLIECGESEAWKVDIIDDLAEENLGVHHLLQAVCVSLENAVD
jgi:hypothetical protein